MTIVDATKKVGMPRSTFYDIVKKNPDVIGEFQEIVEANARHQIGLILFHKNVILQKIIEDALSEETKPRDRLAIYKALGELEDDLSYALQLDTQAEKKGREYLWDGPELRYAESKLPATITGGSVAG
jgi:ACT domain-containing protein